VHLCTNLLGRCRAAWLKVINIKRRVTPFNHADGRRLRCLRLTPFMQNVYVLRPARQLHASETRTSGEQQTAGPRSPRGSSARSEATTTLPEALPSRFVTLALVEAMPSRFVTLALVEAMPWSLKYASANQQSLCFEVKDWGSAVPISG